MRTGLQLRQTQQLSMTPQLQQAIGLLQLSTIELETQLREALESNVMLEEIAPTDEEAEAEASNDKPEEHQKEKDTELDFDASTTTNVDADWDSAAVESSATGNESGNETSAPMLRDDPQAAASGDLRSHLTWQLALTPMSDIDHAIALTLIDALDDNGYLTEPVDALCQIFQSTADSGIDADTVTVDEIEAVRHRLQHFDPVGVAATDLADCLTAQLRQFAATTPGLTTANQLVTNYLDLLAKGDIALLCRRLNLDSDQLQIGIDLVRSLDPRPGSRVSASTPDYIVPDVLVRRHAGKWRVELNTDALPHLRINKLYAESIGGKGAHGNLRNQLTEARWLLRSLEQRNTTLLQVATAIVDRQQAFLNDGEEHSRPMVLRDIAEVVELHESTVSRVTTRKYMHTPRGIYELKYFFSSQLGPKNGEASDTQSSTAVQAMIRKLIVEEHPRKPISDSAIAKSLSGRGVTVARRTIAKYREAMAIPPSHERKRLETGA